ncbi:P-loop containing nucleoside triphosphate hydrolase protein [Mytilinidion resinicola]|uniref:P-loop containing nucleoside triphosphate hydrolase protein n=1 Tax=Mytilinidion resinicola TaxID=574789 RepID=A0A6A6XZJ2_9PEZI|nr:P-loop containing nucleoside triphosphate hydrolase protein [Mytilinidion resinicola]KAF2801819.1 P-loop containing nucleoside triphosphate hydrolase protein [Mytilinidion resinicola]
MGILFGQLVDDLNSATCSAGIGDADAYQSSVDDKVLQVVYISIGGFAAIYIYVLSWSLVGQRLAQRIREKYFKSLLRQQVSFFDNLQAGEVSSRLNGDITIIQTGTSEKVGICIASCSFFVTAYIVAFIKDARLAGILVSLVPAFLLMSLVGGKFVGKYSTQMTNYAASAASIASEALSHVYVVHAFGANARLESKFAGNLMSAQKSGIKKALAAAAQSGMLYFIAYSANGVAYWQGSRTIANAVASEDENSTVGKTYTVIFILVDASLILSQIAPLLQIFGSASAAFLKLRKDIEHVSTIDGTVDPGNKPPLTGPGHVEFRNVSFSYPSRPDQEVLQDISLTCPAGQHTAIVGLSGSGKSTLASLLVRLYDPTKGQVVLDGQDISALNVRGLRSVIGLVQQEPLLLDRSILENIALGLINSAEHAQMRPILQGPQLSNVAASVRNGEDVMEAAKTLGAQVVNIVDAVRRAVSLADATEFISRLQYGLGTMVGSSGNLVSGGQRQRLALAQALIRDPKVLVLDEATSSLDSMSEKRIQASIESIACGRTLVSIAHRLSTIKNADNIIVMGKGQILEQGSYDELVEIGGSFANMIHLQSSSTSQGDTSSRQSLTDVSIDDTTNAKDDLVSSVKHSDSKLNDDSKPGDTENDTTSKDTDGSESKSTKSIWSFKRSAWIFRPYLLSLILAFSTSIVVGGSYSGSGVIFGNTVASLSPCNEPDRIRSRGALFALLFFLLGVIEFFANFISWSAFGFVAEKLLYVVRVLSFRSLFEQDLQWHQSLDRNPTMLLSYITRDSSDLAGFTGSIMGTIFSIVVNLFAAIILCHIVAWKIAIVCLTTVPILLGSGVMQLRVLSKYHERHATAFSTSVGMAVEAINSIKMVSALSLEDEILATYRRSLQTPRKEMVVASAYANLWLAIANSCGNFTYALAYWWGARQIIAGKYNQTQFFIVVLAMLVSAQLWGQMFALAPDVSRARSALSRIVGLIDIGSSKTLEPKNQDPDSPESSEKDVEAFANSKEKPNSRNGVSVSFKDVSFSYPARPDIQILNEMSFTVQPGQFCALVGPSGAGKSTVMALIERMYAPTSGTVEIDGFDLSKRQGTAFRSQITLVPQDSVLFEGSVRFNVSLGAHPDHEATDAEIEEACKLANIHSTIVSLSDGYDTECGPNGSQLSGGQRQRLAIARALVRKPKLLLLDESTSALDAESEKLLQDGLEKAARDITVIAIAHRLHTIRKADVIFLVEGGTVVDRGRHEELIERSQSYRVNALHQMMD